MTGSYPPHDARSGVDEGSKNCRASADCPRTSVVMPGWVLSYLDHQPKQRTHSNAHNLRKFSEFVL